MNCPFSSIACLQAGLDRDAPPRTLQKMSQKSDSFAWNFCELYVIEKTQNAFGEFRAANVSSFARPLMIPNPDDRSSRLPSVVGRRDVSLGFGGSSEPRGAGPALSGGPVSGGTVPLADRLAPQPGPERAGGGAGHRLRPALGRRGRAPLRRGRAGRPRRSAARERRRRGAPGPRGRGGAAGRVVQAARRRRPVDRSQGGGVDGGPARPQGVAAARLGLPQEARPQRAGAEAAARQGGEPRGAGGVQKKLAAEVGERRERDPGRAVEVWAFDEHRLGLKPVLRRQWAPRGQRPIAVGRHRYEWLYLY